MTATALGFVLFAALLHATWNLLAKRTGGGVVLVWLYGTVSAVLLTVPGLFLIVIERPDIRPGGPVFTLAVPRHGPARTSLLRRESDAGRFWSVPGERHQRRTRYAFSRSSPAIRIAVESPERVL